MRTFDLDQFWPDLSPEAADGRDRLQAGAKTASESGLTAHKKPDADAFTHYEPPPLISPESAAAPELVAPASRVSTPRDRTPFVYGGIGFLAGIFAWHILGFWTFVSTIVATPAAPSPHIAVARSVRSSPEGPSVRPAAAPTTTGSLQPSAQAIFNLDPKSCLALVLDRASGLTRVEKCPEDSRPMRDAGRQRRGDLTALARNVDPNAWAQGTAVDTAIGDGENTLNPSDVDLQITMPKPETAFAN